MTEATSTERHRVRPGVTWRSLLVGSLGSLAIGLGDPYGIHVIHGSYMALDFSTAGAVFLLFVLVFVVNRALGWLRSSWALSPAELITVYIMMIVACALSTMGLAAQLVPIITAPFYYATPENEWAFRIQPYVKPNLFPRPMKVITDFYEGLPEGEAIPWHAWLTPLAHWIPFLLALYLVMISMAVLLRRQWVERERLAFPLTHLPMEMVQESSGERSFFRNPVMWIGFAIPFLIGTLTALNHYYPSVPGPQLWTQVETFRGTSLLTFRLSFAMVGFLYLVNLDVLFSLWIFNLLFQITTGVMYILGAEWRENLGIYGSPNPLFAHMGMGAIAVLVAVGIWLAKEHLGQAARRALGRDRSVDDAREIMSYRSAFIVMVLGLVGMAVWLCWSGVSAMMVGPFLLAGFVIFIGLTRMVAETGLAEAVASTIAPGFAVSGFGVGPFGPRGLVGLALSYVWCSDIRTYVHASTTHGLKMTDIMPVHGRRRIFWAILLAVIIAGGSSIWLTLVLGYKLGGVTLNTWFLIDGPKAPYNWAVAKIAQPNLPHQAGWIATIFGAGVMAVLMMLRQLFWRWPLHPVGFAVGSVWIMDQIWMTCMLTWLLKAMILRWGGLRLYNILRPAFLGLVLGQFACNGIWLVIDALTGMKGNQIFWI